MLLVARSAGRGTPCGVVCAKMRGARAGVRVWVWVLAWEGEREEEEEEDGGREERPRLYSTPLENRSFLLLDVGGEEREGEGRRGKEGEGERREKGKRELKKQKERQRY